MLFADIKGSTEVARVLDPEDWFLVLERFHELATGSIHRFDGIVTLVAGDGVMALFGAPVAHESHAAQACWAALRLTEQMQALATDLAPIIGARLDVRVGINSGEVVVGRIGNETRVDYTAQGLPVHIAARMEQIADVGEIFVGPSTAALVGGQFEFALVGERQVKGITEPILVHRLLGPVDPLLTAGMRPTPRSAEFVGRDAELDLLRAALADARAGHARVVGLCAPAGYGKSRLVGEFLDEARARGSDVITVVGDVVTSPGALWTAAELARALLEVGPETDAAAIDLALIDLEPALGAESAPLLSLLTADVGEVSVDPDVARRQIDASLRALVEARANADTGALVIAIDDVHAIDRASQLTMATLLAEPFGAPVVIVLTSRPTLDLIDLLPDDAQLIDLESLCLEEIEQLVQQWLVDRDEVARGRPAPPRADGWQPVLRRGDAAIVGRIGSAGRAERGTTARDAPRRAHGAGAGSDRDRIAHRSGRPRPARPPVRGGGDRCRVRSNDAGDGCGDRRRRNARLLVELVAADLVRPVDEGRYAFSHRITQEVAYDTQLREQRRRGHAAVAAAFEKLPGSQRRAALVADHYERAGNLEAAANWYSRGAVVAARTDPAESLRQWQKVRELTVATDADSVTAALLCRAEILTQSARCGLDAGEVVAVIDEARELAGTHDEHRPLLAFVLIRGWYAVSSAGLSSQARAISKEAVVIADTTGIAMLSVGARVANVSNFNAAGSVARGLAECDEAEAILVGAGLDALNSLLRCQLDFARGSLMVRAGLIDASVSVFESALTRAESCDDPQWRVICRAGLAFALVARRDAVAARRVAEEAVAIAREVCGAGELGLAMQSFGFAALAAGEIAAAITALDGSLATARSAPALATEEMTLAALADAHLLAGDVSEADRLAEEAVAIAQNRGNDNYELMALLVRARVLVADPASDRAAIAKLVSRCEQLLTFNQMDGYRAELDEIVAALTRNDERVSVEGGQYVLGE